MEPHLTKQRQLWFPIFSDLIAYCTAQFCQIPDKMKITKRIELAIIVTNDRVAVKHPAQDADELSSYWKNYCLGSRTQAQKKRTANIGYRV